MAELDAGQLDRAAGVLLGAACGDALGVPYESTPPQVTRTVVPEMVGGGLGDYAPGEYSDDTQMAVCIAKVAATGVDLRTEEALRAIAANFVEWFPHATNIGISTCLVVRPALGRPDPHVAMRAASAALHAETGRTAGNGSLMRTAIVALAYLDDVAGMAEAARAISELTHFDPLAGDACVLWCAGVRRAVLDGTFDGVREGLALLPEERRGDWARWLTEAEQNPPHHFYRNGYVVRALQAAWSAITRTPVPATDPASPVNGHYRNALIAAIRAGSDTDTVAAIAGALLGARWGVGAIPSEWREAVHGWPGLRADDLIQLALSTARSGAGASSTSSTSSAPQAHASAWWW